MTFDSPFSPHQFCAEPLVRLQNKCLEAFKKMNLITGQSYTKKYPKLPEDDEPEV